MSPSRLRLSLLLVAALLVVLVPSVALAKSAKSKSKGRSAAAADAWTWSKALNATGRYDVTVRLKRVPGARRASTFCKSPALTARRASSIPRC